MLKFSGKVLLVWTDRCLDWTQLLPQINYTAPCVCTVVSVCGVGKPIIKHELEQDTLSLSVKLPS